MQEVNLYQPVSKGVRGALSAASSRATLLLVSVALAGIWGFATWQVQKLERATAVIRNQAQAQAAMSASAGPQLDGLSDEELAALVARLSAYFNGASDPAVRADLINLDFHLDRADRWIETGAAGVSQEVPNAADLQIGSGVRLLLTIEDLRPRLDGRPCAELAMRWFAHYPGHVPAGTLPAEWLAARAPARV